MVLPLHKLKAAQGLFVLLVIWLLAVAMSPTTLAGENIFLSPGNLTDMLRATAPVGIMALAMTFVIITGGIDLSVGSLMALSAVVTSILLTSGSPAMPEGLRLVLAIAGGMLSAGLVGALHGGLIATLRLQPFVITLATMIGVRGFCRVLTTNEKVLLGIGDDLPGRFADMFSEKIWMIGSFLFLAVVCDLLLRRTVFGRYVMAIGNNERASRYAALPIAWIKIGVYVLCGLFAGIAGVFHAARTTTGDPNAGIAWELDVIAVVVIGGASLMGGKGSIPGTINGVLIVGILTNILGLRNVDSNMQLLLKSVIIILAVALQQKRSRT